MEKEEFKDIKKTFRNIPEALKNPFKFKNGKYLIYNGDYDLVSSDGTKAKVNGKLYFQWQNRMGLNFEGTIIESNIVFWEYSMSQNIEINIEINSNIVGKIFLVRYNENSNPMTVDGFINGSAKFIETKIKIKQISFVIPNFKERHGIPTKTTTKTRFRTNQGRLPFEGKDYKITLDCVPDYKEIYESILEKGGIAITYIGKLEKIKGEFTEKEIEKIFKRFRIFLSFINGSWTAPMLVQAKNDNQICWSDYTGKRINPLNKNRNWYQWNEFEEINKVWNKIIEFDEDEFEVFNTLINWYIESQHKLLNNEAAIILVQNGLELLFNWIIVENNKIAFGDDAEKLHTHNKFRILFSFLKIPYNIPKGMVYLPNWAKTDFAKKSNIIDGSTAITQIRNSLIHPKLANRNKLSKIDGIIKHEILRLSTLYLELGILNLVGYNGRFENRCKFFEKEYENGGYVPWVDFEVKSKTSNKIQ